MKILVLRVSAIGDVIHTLPAIHLIKKLYPKAFIGWVVQKKAVTLLKHQSFLNKTYLLPDNYLHLNNLNKTIKVIKEIKKENWDLILDFQGILKTSIISFFIKGKKIGFTKKHCRLGFTSYLTDEQVDPKYKNIIQKNLALVSHALYKHKKMKSSPSINAISDNFDFNISEEDKNIIDNWINKNKLKKFILLSPNTTWPSKHWPEDNWIKLIKILSNKMENQIVLLGKDFGDQSENIYKYCENNNLKITATPKFNLLQTAYLIKQSQLLLAPDTGILHLADYLQKNAIGIFGPTKAFRHGAFLHNFNIKKVEQINCPHYYQKTHGKDKVNKNSGKNSNCMYKLTPETLAKKIVNIIT